MTFAELRALLERAKHGERKPMDQGGNPILEERAAWDAVKFAAANALPLLLNIAEDAVDLLANIDDGLYRDRLCASIKRFELEPRSKITGEL